MVTCLKQKPNKKNNNQKSKENENIAVKLIIQKRKKQNIKQSSNREKIISQIFLSNYPPVFQIYALENYRNGLNM